MHPGFDDEEQKLEETINIYEEQKLEEKINIYKALFYNPEMWLIEQLHRYAFPLEPLLQYHNSIFNNPKRQVHSTSVCK